MMTTIATDGVTIAGDGKITSGDTITDLNRVKVFRLPDGTAIGYAGDLISTSAFHSWMVAGADANNRPTLSENFAAVRINGSSTVLLYDDEYRSVEMPVPYATGSGRNFALAAMDAGLPPKDAVAIAAKRDVYSGGRVRSVTVKL